MESDTAAPGTRKGLFSMRAGAAETAMSEDCTGRVKGNPRASKRHPSQASYLSEQLECVQSPLLTLQPSKRLAECPKEATGGSGHVSQNVF